MRTLFITNKDLSLSMVAPLFGESNYLELNLEVMDYDSACDIVDEYLSDAGDRRVVIDVTSPELKALVVDEAGLENCDDGDIADAKLGCEIMIIAEKDGELVYTLISTESETD